MNRKAVHNVVQCLKIHHVLFSWRYSAFFIINLTLHDQSSFHPIHSVHLHNFDFSISDIVNQPYSKSASTNADRYPSAMVHTLNVAQSTAFYPIYPRSWADNNRYTRLHTLNSPDLKQAQSIIEESRAPPFIHPPGTGKRMPKTSLLHRAVC